MTRRSSTVWRVVALVVGLGLLGGTSAQMTAQREQSDGWQIPPNAQAETNPVAATPAVLAKGKDLYGGKCRRCHGPAGKGDGADADPDHRPADLTDSARAARNPDGVMFYKIWNGRRRPKMPAFSSDLSREEVWTVIQYVKTLRK